MKPQQIILFALLGIGAAYFLSKRKPAATATNSSSAQSLATMTSAYQFTADQNASLQQQLDDASNRANTFQSAYQSLANGVSK